jgi:hypothetical protein
MPFNATQIDQIGHYAINLYAKNEPVDQVNTAHPFYNWLVQNKVEEPAVGQFYSENIYISNDSNGQNYFGADQVDYNSRDPGRQTQWAWYNYHNGFGFDEDTLKAAGIIKTDDREAQASGAEQSILMNRLKVAYMSMKKGTQEDLAIEFLYDGSNSTKAVPGVGNIISLTPATGTIGGIDAVTNTYWRNNTALGIVTTTPSAGLINAALKSQWRASTRFGGAPPTRIFAGQAFIEALEAENRAISHLNVTQNNSGKGMDYDGGTAGTKFDGIPVVWDPTFELLDAKYAPATPYTKRAYMVSESALTLRPVTGFWQLDRKPPRVYDRYVHYWARTCSYRLTTNQRNGLSVLSIA